jgi:hypothetical protein
MAVPALILVLTATVAAGTRAQEPPEKPDRPFTVLVRASESGEAEKDKDLVQASEELRKQIASRRRWFRTASESESAEIVVEVEEHRVREFLTFWASTETMSGETQGVNRSSISRNHFLRAKVTLFAQELSLTGIDKKRNGSLKGAASALARELEKICRERYASFERQRPE